MTGRNGYLYGRGVSDNKGPVLSVACAASALLAKRELEVDLVMLVEGEEEAGSGGFAEAVRRNKVCGFRWDSLWMGLMQRECVGQDRAH